MIIDGFKVGEYTVKEEGGVKHLIFDCRDCVYSANVAGDRRCRYHVFSALAELDADLVVLAEVYERVYNEEQTALMKQMGKVIAKFNVDTPWSYSHLGDSKVGEKFFGARHDIVSEIANNLIRYDPLQAYMRVLQEIEREKRTAAELTDATLKKDAQAYLGTLDYLRKVMEQTNLIRIAMRYLAKLRQSPDTTQFYRALLQAEVKPSFIGSRLLFGKVEKFELLDEYQVGDSNVQIFRHPEKIEKLYFLYPPEYNLPPEKYFIVSKTKEMIASFQPGKVAFSAMARTRQYFERIYEGTIRDVAKANKIEISREEISDLAKIVARYTIGYGVLEILLSDRRITDIYVDSPIGSKPLYIVHSDYDQCQTNVIYTEDEASAVVSKFRAMSGRPFDEAHPVMDYDLPKLETRVAVIGRPLSPDGTAFAFRLHKTTPWTLPQFLNVKMLSPLAAGMISFFIDNKSTMLVAGSRGSGKTSMMGSLLQEIIQNTRVLVQEDTLELPVPYLRKIGMNIQRMKTQSAIGVAVTEAEVPPDEALRTALRLGDSAIILGEVRSKEAKVLYEAMRVGAAGNVVMGTIHGDSAYSCWDRVVNDLEVPTTSFKATDIVTVSAPIRFGGSLKRHRRVIEITELKKQWTADPLEEGALLELMTYNAKTDSLELMEDNLKDSDLFKKISKNSGLSMEQMWEDISMRADAKQFMVEQANKNKIPGLLEAEYAYPISNKLLLLKERMIEETGAINYPEVLGQWKFWLRQGPVKRLVQRKAYGKKK